MNALRSLVAVASRLELAVGSGLALAAVASALTLAACSSGPPRPADLDPRNEACASCRMAISEPRFASQLVSAHELPRFFDDLFCLGAFVKAGHAPKGAVAFVADHRTRAWVRADQAVYTRIEGLATPMASHVVAHADGASRDQDGVARNGAPVAPPEIFGAMGPPRGDAP